MDPGPAAQTPEAKRRKIKRHAGQMPDTAWPSQGQPKMVGKSKDASHSAKSGPHARVEDNEDQKRSTWPSQPESGKPSAQRPKLKQRAQHGAAAQQGPPATHQHAGFLQQGGPACAASSSTADVSQGLGRLRRPSARGFNHHGEEGHVLGCACISCVQVPALVSTICLRSRSVS